MSNDPHDWAHEPDNDIDPAWTDAASIIARLLTADTDDELSDALRATLKADHATVFSIVAALAGIVCDLHDDYYEPDDMRRLEYVAWGVVGHRSRHMNKYMQVDEFRNNGYLAEINRRFLHPLGLAMSVNLVTGEYAILDERHDPEGRYMGEPLDDVREKAAMIAAEETARRPAREAALGYWIQPL